MAAACSQTTPTPRYVSSNEMLKYNMNPRIPMKNMYHNSSNSPLLIQKNKHFLKRMQCMNKYNITHPTNDTYGSPHKMLNALTVLFSSMNLLGVS